MRTLIRTSAIFAGISYIPKYKNSLIVLNDFLLALPSLVLPTGLPKRLIKLYSKSIPLFFNFMRGFGVRA
jgi:hypothetical protein